MAAIPPEPVPPDMTAPTRTAVRTAALAGIRDAAPLVAGHLPFALVIGVTVAAAPPVLARWLSTILIFGGSAQLITLELLDAGSPLLLVIGAGLVTNARILAYS